MADDSNATLMTRLGGQGALLFSGFALSQALSFARNAVIGHWLSRGDFGVAATITLSLQLIEALSDVGVDRLIVQAEDGDDPRVVATAHSTLILRGMLTSLALFLVAGPVTMFFQIPQALWAFEVVALVPLIKGFMHLDPRRFQRRLRNGPQIIAEVVPQAMALAACAPVLLFAPNFEVVVWVSLLQAVTWVIVSHCVSERGYQLALDRGYLWRLFQFGWPIWLGAFPLIAVLYGDRILIGRMFGMDVLGGYSAAFMITMVPGLVAAKIGHALMLPLLAEKRGDRQTFLARFGVMADLTTVVACAYVFGFVSIGGCVLPLVFGSNYQDLGLVVGWLSVMWGIRMLQVVPGMGLMALGETRPFLVAGLVRTLGLVVAIGAVWAGFGIIEVVIAGVLGEMASHIYVSLRMSRERTGAAEVLFSRALWLLPAAIAGFLAAWFVDGNAVSVWSALGTGVFGAVVVVGVVGAALPGSRDLGREVFYSLARGWRFSRWSNRAVNS